MVLLLIVLLELFCLMMVIGGGGWPWALAGLAILGFLVLVALKPMPSGGEGVTDSARKPCRPRVEDLDELDDFMDMQDDV